MKGKSQYEDFRLPPRAVPRAERPLLISLHKSGSHKFLEIFKIYYEI